MSSRSAFSSIERDTIYPEVGRIIPQLKDRIIRSNMISVCKRHLALLKSCRIAWTRRPRRVFTGTRKRRGRRFYFALPSFLTKLKTSQKAADTKLLQRSAKFANARAHSPGRRCDRLPTSVKSALLSCKFIAVCEDSPLQQTPNRRIAKRTKFRSANLRSLFLSEPEAFVCFCS
jgi:hypothetical protein